MLIKIQNVHFIAKTNQSFRLYSKLCELDKAKGLTTSQYQSDKTAAKEIVGDIAASSRNQRKEKSWGSSTVLSATMDGTTDFMGDEMENIYTRMVSNGVVEDFFISIGSPTGSDAESLYNHLTSSLTEYFETDSWKKHVASVCFDGAKTMQGHLNGVGVRMKQIIPWLLVVHCLAHRVELSIKDSIKSDPYYEKMITLLLGIYYLYRKSAPLKNELKEACNVLDRKFMMPSRAGGTRFVRFAVFNCFQFLSAEVGKKGSHRNFYGF